MNKLIFRKLSYDILTFFLLSSLSITSIVWVIQGVNLLDIVTEKGHSINVYFYYSLLSIPKIFGNDGALSKSNKYEFSKIIDVPDLSFVGTVYSGLDILEQMDFKPLRNKTIAILTNQSAVNRNNQHLLDLLIRYSIRLDPTNPAPPVTTIIFFICYLLFNI